MRALHLPLAFLVVLNLLAQEAPRLILVSHDTVDGPMGGDHLVQDLKVFEDGKVVYAQEGTGHQLSGQSHSAYEATISATGMETLKRLLDSSELRSLPEKVRSKIQPTDFFWQKSLQINRGTTTQNVKIANFYPFLNLHGDAYPEVLIQLECRLQDIEAAAANRMREDWCQELLNKEKAHTGCKQDEEQSRIIADVGWGPIRVGAPLEAIEAFLGKGKLGARSSGVYFKSYKASGLGISFNDASNTVHAIYFYHGQRNSPNFAVFCGQVEKNITWQSSIEDVRKAFGTPSKEESGTDLGDTWTRLAFDGIDFRFENGKMVRIGVPGN